MDGATEKLFLCYCLSSDPNNIANDCVTIACWAQNAWVFCQKTIKNFWHLFTLQRKFFSLFIAENAFWVVLRKVVVVLSHVLCMERSVFIWGVNEVFLEPKVDFFYHWTVLGCGTDKRQLILIWTALESLAKMKFVRKYFSTFHWSSSGRREEVWFFIYRTVEQHLVYLSNCLARRRVSFMERIKLKAGTTLITHWWQKSVT